MTNARPWGRGEVLRAAGGSTGQSTSGKRWPELTQLIAERYHASLNGPDSQDSLDSQDSQDSHDKKAERDHR